MKKIVIVGLLGLLTTGAFAQMASSNFDIYKRTIDLNEKSLAFGLTEAEFAVVEPQAYVNYNFVKGNIYQEDKAVQKDVLMRYNAFSDEIEIKKTEYDTDYGALTKNPDIFVKIGSDLYMYVPYAGAKDKGGYFQILTDGKKYDLYKRVTAVFREGKKAASTYERDRPHAFTQTTTYYLVDNGTFFEMPKGKSKIMAMMKDKKKEVNDYVKVNKLDIDKEADLIQVISYFDSLQ